MPLELRVAEGKKTNAGPGGLLGPWWIAAVFILLAVGVVGYEVRTSSLQAWLLSRYAARLRYAVTPGRSDRIIFPASGPFDDRRGYSRIPAFLNRLESRGFRVASQARLSPELARLAAWGVAPYAEPSAAGLAIRGVDGATLFDAVPAGNQFREFDEIPPLLVDSLLFIENRELPEPPHPHNNPAVEWDRLAKAGLFYAGHKLGLPLPLQGGSTLAVQLEKYRHSPRGRTASVGDKLRQVASASLKAYLGGFDTRPWRREIVAGYFNTMPLSAAPGYGEVYGLGEGLYAWFGLRLATVKEVLRSREATSAKAHAYKHALALLAALPAPTRYLIEDRAGLEKRVELYLGLLVEAGILDREFADRVEDEPLLFLPMAPGPERTVSAVQKAPSAIRTRLLALLDLPGLYDLDRLDLEVQGSIDVGLQNEVETLFRNLRARDWVEAHGLRQERLLDKGDPAKIYYSLTLFERTPGGNAVRVRTDNVDVPFDINAGGKLELGSTAKLRTLAHYLELVASLHAELAPLEPPKLLAAAKVARDPITRWAAETLAGTRERLPLEAFLDRALERKYSASPYELFYTAGGAHTFRNFDEKDDRRVPTVRDAFVRSTNLVFIRLMRDLVRFHRARLPYDADRILSDAGDPERLRMLKEAVEHEARRLLFRTCREYRGLEENLAIARLMGSRKVTRARLAMIFHAWQPGAGPEAFGAWLKPRIFEAVSPAQIELLSAAYGKPHFQLEDYGYLLRRHPIEVWCAGEVMRNPNLSWPDLVARSAEARRAGSAWLFKTRNRGAQNARLRTRIEEDAFARMTPYWRQLGFPFRRLVPSLATAIGNSSDKPAALADLMGVILNDGVRRPAVYVSRLRFAGGTPYETAFEPTPGDPEQAMAPAVARALREALAEVVARGTARRVAGSFAGEGGSPVVAGGKTGSGDNRFKTFNRFGGVVSDRAVNRTATFVFYVGDRYFGAITAYVPGAGARKYAFTSALPVTILKLLAPAINQRLAAPPPSDEERTFVRQEGPASPAVDSAAGGKARS